jgi:tRNA(Ile2) C34 agmatinyltransferase TiaS
MSSVEIEVDKRILDVVQKYVGKKFLVVKDFTRDRGGLVLIGLDMDDLAVNLKPARCLGIERSIEAPLCWICGNPLEPIGRTGKYYCMECGKQQVPTEASAPEYYKKPV